MRLRRKAHKAKARLDADISNWFSVQRPKRMWRRTFERLRRKAFDLEMEADQEFDSRCAQLNERIEKKERKKASAPGKP